MYIIIWNKPLLRELHVTLFFGTAQRVFRKGSSLMAEQKTQAQTDTLSASSLPNVYCNSFFPSLPDTLFATHPPLLCEHTHRFTVSKDRDGKKCLRFSRLCWWDWKLAPQGSDCKRSNPYMTLTPRCNCGLYQYPVFLWLGLFSYTEIDHFPIAYHQKHWICFVKLQ